MSHTNTFDTLNNNDIYSFEKKQKLADKISAMRDKPTLRKIRDIIKTENPLATEKKNSTGYLMFFHNYTDITYIKIDFLLNKIDQDKIAVRSKTMSDLSDNIVMSSEEPENDSDVDYTVSRTRLRYSNREKRLIKRQQYESIINDQSNNDTNSIFSSSICMSDSSIFSPKSSIFANNHKDPIKKQNPAK